MVDFNTDLWYNVIVLGGNTMNEIIRKELNFTTLQQEYLDYIDVAPKTVETYNIALRQFVNYLRDNGIKEPTRQDVIAFREELRENHSVSTVNSYLIAIRNFFRFLQYNGIYKNITENVKSLKDTELHKREALSQEECRKVISCAKNLREKALVTLTLVCGLRANEIVNIRLSDFKYENGNNVLYILGKGRDSKQDYVIIPDSLLELLKEYVREYAIRDYLFVSTSNHNAYGKLNTCTVRRMINTMFERVGVKRDTVTFHSLRHSMATLSIENGLDIREVSKALRHKSIKTTEVYLHDLEMKNNKCSEVMTQNVLGGIF